MKKTAILLFLVVSGISLFAQSDKYKQAMLQRISELEGSIEKRTVPALANSFERIAEAEKTQWLPYYYAAYCQVMSALIETDKSKVDAMAEKATTLIKKAEELAGEANSEINVVYSMIATAQLTVDPANRWMQYGQTSANYMNKAKQQDPTNPRPLLLDGQSKLFTPEQFGGGKAIAAPLFEKSIELFDQFKPASDLHPTWGKSSATYFLAQCK